MKFPPITNFAAYHRFRNVVIPFIFNLEVLFYFLLDFFIDPLVSDHHKEDMGPDKTTSLPLLSISVLLFLHCGMAVLLVFGSFSERVVLYVIVVLFCSWEDLFYITILNMTSGI